MPKRVQILVCDGPSCGVMYESEQLKAHLEKKLAGTDDPQVRICDWTCFGRCDDGPNVFVRTLEEGQDIEEEPDDPDLVGRGLYTGNNPDRLDAIVDGHVIGGEALDDAEEY